LAVERGMFDPDPDPTDWGFAVAAVEATVLKAISATAANRAGAAFRRESVWMAPRMVEFRYTLHP
jgi:hypothetical protein